MEDDCTGGADVQSRKLYWNQSQYILIAISKGYSKKEVTGRSKDSKV